MSLQRWNCSKCNTSASFGSVDGLRTQLKRKGGTVYASSELQKRSSDSITKTVSAEISAETHLRRAGKHKVTYNVWDEKTKKYNQKWVKETDNPKAKKTNIFSKLFKRPTPSKT
jgi:hypothetical protein